MGDEKTTILMWFDLETTGLSPEKDHMLEIGVTFTDERLDALDDIALYDRTWTIGLTGPVTLDPVVVRMHTTSGLFQKLVDGPNWTVEASESTLVRLVEKAKVHVGGEVTVVLAGDSVHFDKSFLRAHMPKLHEMLSYRVFDTSTLKQAYRSWVTTPDLFPKGEAAHRALDDVMFSLGEARRMRNWMRGAYQLPSMQEVKVTA